MEKTYRAAFCSPTQYHYEHTLSCIVHGIPMIWLEQPPAEESLQEVPILS